MSNAEATGKKISKKDVRQLVYDKLALSLAELKTGIKEKKFESTLQKASKLFAEEIVKASKSSEKAKKPARKKAKQKDVKAPE